MNPIPPAEPTPTVATATATSQMPMTKSAATSIAVAVTQGTFKAIPHPTTKFQEGEGPSTPAITVPRNSSLKMHPLS